MKIVCLIAALSVSSAAFAADDAEAILKKGKCTVCHSLEKRILGPSFVSVAAMYKDVADAQTRLEAKVRNGGSGSWGTMPMPALPKKDLSDAEVKTVVTWILSHKPR
jgi:cytochrome c